MVSRPAFRRPGYGLPGLVVTCAGTGLLLVAFLLLDWFEGIDRLGPPRSYGIDPHVKLTLRGAYVASTESPLGPLVQTYVAWAGWLLVFAVVLAALAASVPGPLANLWRAAGTLVGVGAAITTYFACQLDFAADPEQRISVDAHAGFRDTLFGGKLALAAFLICAAGAALGPLGARTGDIEAGGAAHSAVDKAVPWRRVGSAAVLAIGSALLVIAFVHTSWYHTDRYDADPQISFGDLVDSDGGRPISRLSSAFFPTLAWVLLIAAVVTGVFANLRTALSPVLRAAGVVIGVSGVVLTYVALSQLFVVTQNPAATHNERGVFHSTGPGLWFAFGGFLLCAVAAAIAPPARAERLAPIG